MAGIREGILKNMRISRIDSETPPPGRAAWVPRLPDAVHALDRKLRQRVMRAATLAWQAGGVVVVARENYGWAAYSIKAAAGPQRLHDAAEAGRLIGFYQIKFEAEIAALSAVILEDIAAAVGAA